MVLFMEYETKQDPYCKQTFYPYEQKSMISYMQVSEEWRYLDKVT